MEEKYYQIVSCPYSEFAKDFKVENHEYAVHTGAIKGEVTANIVRKWYSAWKTDRYFRMVEIDPVGKINITHENVSHIIGYTATQNGW